MRRVVLILVLGSILMAGCSDGGDRDARGPAGVPVTHQEASSEEALIRGVLEGTPDCLWLEIGDGRHALILPSGSATRQSGDEVVLLDGGGNEVARSGDEVAVTGGFRPDEAPCPDAEPTGPVVVAGHVQRSAELPQVHADAWSSKT